MELSQEQYYSYEEYINIDDENRYELTNGKLYMMSSPSNVHQSISTELLIQIGTFLRGKTCQVTHDFNVRLWKDEDTVYIPDILVVCDNSKMNETECTGAPDFIIEIVSPSNAYRDFLIKLNEYRRSGVKEYWIIDPESKKVYVHIFDNGRYITTIYNEDAVIPVSVLPGLEIKLADLWARMG